MKKTLSIVLVLFFLSSRLFGQIENISQDSVTTLLCHKWSVKAMYMAGQQINSSGETVTYEFHMNKTFVRVTDKKTEKGIWAYEPNKTVVHLTIKKKTNLYITSLKPNEFELSTRDLQDGGNNSLSIKVLFKVIDE